MKVIFTVNVRSLLVYIVNNAIHAAAAIESRVVIIVSHFLVCI